MMEPPAGTEALVELSFHGRSLRNMDFFSKSDPFVVVYVGDQQSYEPSQFQMIGRTETVWDNLNPDFVSKFYLKKGQMEQDKTRVLLQFYDQDSKEVEELTPEYLKMQDFIGQVTFNVEELLSVDHRLLSIRLNNRKGAADKKSGTAVITAEEISRRTPAVEYSIEFRFTADCEMPRRKKIFIILSRCVPYPSTLGPKWIPVYRTGALEPPVKSGQEFSFQDFTLVGEQLNAMDDERKLRIELYIFKKNGSHVLQGCVELSITKLNKVESDYMFPIVQERDSSLTSGFVFQPGSMVSSNSAALGIPSSLRFYFTRLSWKNRF
eukprot:Plantae.Rhodophyta-Purpureofilum_apyrenoidigerum.ctg2485.p1 GENE.Plantae.Rhodophyta-Purpureofilum_apyrenoidigerum.ctg2485~~Plantae.Rhodophyta-Purpureofilum_apyrenoidigerum.ctg2485.p1  ORF type:complete len:322 (-),score=67.20 Plantae.Rhodophyta-Purpureofilum_apyrenoidigerum.ctg2485:163-1128(-)